MKEIDFIPEWYKADRKRKRRYVRQCTWIGIVLTVLMVWSFVEGRHVNTLRAQVEDIQASFERQKARVEQAQEAQHHIAAMQEKIRMLADIAPRTKISALLGEVSYLTGGHVVLSRLSFQNEPLEEERPKAVTPSAAVVQAAASDKKEPAPAMQRLPWRTKVILTGIAGTPADAAALISALEETDYLEQVAPVFTRAKKIKEANVTEFEIRCYVADYQVLK